MDKRCSFIFTGRGINHRIIFPRDMRLASHFTIVDLFNKIYELKKTLKNTRTKTKPTFLNLLK